MKVNILSLLKLLLKSPLPGVSGKGSSEKVVSLLWVLLKTKQKPFSYEKYPGSSIAINPSYFKGVNKQEMNSFVTLKTSHIGGISVHSVCLLGSNMGELLFYSQELSSYYEVVTPSIISYVYT